MAMANQSYMLFGKAMSPDRQLDEFFFIVSETNLLFHSGIISYLDSGTDGVEFQTRLKKILEHEKDGNTLSRLLETNLRSFVEGEEMTARLLSLLEQINSLQRMLVKYLCDFDIEHPLFPVELHDELRQLTKPVSLAVEACIELARSYVRSEDRADDFLGRIAFYEKEADKHMYVLLREIFARPMGLAEQSHLRRFVEKMDEPANKAQDVATWLAVQSIQHATKQ